jgi:hypothetical protein
MLYEPPRSDRYLWDTWLLPTEEGYHLFHMQKVAGAVDSTEIGHSFSPDLVRWAALDPAMTLRSPGHWDSVRFRTGDALFHDGRYYLFYGSAPEHIDLVGVATSTDLVHWERHGDQPIAVPDPRWYEHDHETCPIGNVPWRDPCVRRDPSGNGWIMYLTARHLAGPLGGRGTVATLHAPDTADGLLHWEVGPPLNVMPGYNVMEVPDVFELDGRWFLLHSTSHRMGTRFPVCDPALAGGTFVLWAERPEGPYTRPPRDVLLGSPIDRMTAYVCRTAQTPHGRIAYYHNVYPSPPGKRIPRGAFALPKGLVVDDHGLKLQYLPLLDPYLGKLLMPPLAATISPPVGLPDGEWEIHGDSATGGVQYGNSALTLQGEALDLMLTTTVTVEEGQAAGVGMRIGPNGRGLAVILDARQGTIGVVEMARGSGGLMWRVLAERQAPVEVGRALALRIILARNVLDVFLEEELMLSVVSEGHGAGGIALIADDARVCFEALHARHLELPAVEARYSAAYLHE